MVFDSSPPVAVGTPGTCTDEERVEECIDPKLGDQYHPAGAVEACLFFVTPDRLAPPDDLICFCNLHAARKNRSAMRAVRCHSQAIHGRRRSYDQQRCHEHDYMKTCAMGLACCEGQSAQSEPLINQ